MSWCIHLVPGNTQTVTCTERQASGKHVNVKFTPYLEKLGFVGVYLFFLFLLQNIDWGYSLEPPRSHNLFLEQK